MSLNFRWGGESVLSVKNARVAHPGGALALSYTDTCSQLSHCKPATRNCSIVSIQGK